MIKQDHRQYHLKTELAKENCSVRFPKADYSVVAYVVVLPNHRFCVFLSSLRWILFDAKNQKCLNTGKTPFVIFSPIAVSDNSIVFFNDDDFQLYSLDLKNNILSTPWVESWQLASESLSLKSLLQKGMTIGAFVRTLYCQKLSRVVLLWQRGRANFRSYTPTDFIFLSCSIQGSTEICELNSFVESHQLRLHVVTHFSILESSQKACIVTKSARGQDQLVVVLVDVLKPQISTTVAIEVQESIEIQDPISLIPVTDDKMVLLRKYQNFGSVYNLSKDQKTLEQASEPYLPGFWPQSNMGVSFMPYKSQKHDLVIFDDFNAEDRVLHVCNQKTGKLLATHNYPRDVLTAFGQCDGDGFVVVKDVIFSCDSNSAEADHSLLEFDWYHQVLTRHQRKLAVLFVLENATFTLNNSKRCKFKELFKSPIVAKDIFNCF